MSAGRSWMAAAGLLVAMAGVARADVPFYGYSQYFGGPATAFSLETDVQQVTKLGEGGVPGFGTRTYYRGGPFWVYRPSHVRAASATTRERRYRSSAALRRKG